MTTLTKQDTLSIRNERIYAIRLLRLANPATYVAGLTISDACEAEELFWLDDLEAFADKLRST